MTMKVGTGEEESLISSGLAQRPSIAEERGYTLVTLSMIQGHMAMWVYRQHPFHEVAGVEDVNKFLTDKATEADGWLTPHILAMKRFKDGREVMTWLHSVLDGHPWLEKWNAPRVDRGQQFAFASRFGKTPAEYDFIDTDALLRNVAFGAFDEAWRDDHPDVRRTEAVVAEPKA